MDRANETLVETETPKLVTDECAVDSSPRQDESESQKSGSEIAGFQPAPQGEKLSASADIEAAAYFQLLGLATSKGAVSINRPEPLFWLAKRFFFSSAIVVLTAIFSLACLVFWIQLFFFIKNAVAPGMLVPSLEIVGRAVGSWIASDQTRFNYAYIATTLVLTLIGWTALHTLRNPILGIARYPWAALQVICGLILIPIPNIAYVLLGPAPEAAFAGQRLVGRVFDELISKVAGAVHPDLRQRDRFAAINMIIYPFSAAILAKMLLDRNCLDMWCLAFLVVVCVVAVRSVLHFVWHRQITACLDGRLPAQWIEQRVRVKHKKVPELLLHMPSGRTVKYYVLYQKQNTPLEIEQLPDTEDCIVPILFEESSARPVAVKFGDEIFPITNGFWNVF